MAHKSAVSMCLNRAGCAIVLFLSHPQDAAVATFQSLDSSIDEQAGNRKVADRTNGYDCDVAHCATYYSVIYYRLVVILWYLIPKFSVIVCVNRITHDVSLKTSIGFVVRSRM